jgi:hypothetical protein
MTQNTSSAVMQQRGSPATALDFFPTPPWAARAGGELIRRLDPPVPGEAARTCWEPACGAGHMAHGLADYFEGGVYASDIHDYGCDAALIDFLAPRPQSPGDIDWIVTNPPFIAAEAFVRQAWPIARRGVALLCRLAFLEGGARHKLLYRDIPLSCVAPFAERVPMVAGRWDPAASSATAYAWFMWLKDVPRGSSPDGSSRDRAGTPHAPPVLIPVPPGTKLRLTRASDFMRFADPSAGELL